MAVIVRIDVDRPYGKHPVGRHVLSRLSSDAYFPRLEAFGYLKELALMLVMLNQHRARAHVFFRFCTVPSRSIRALLEHGNHDIGLHLEDSRSFETFQHEKQDLERRVGKDVVSFSKHGSGNAKYGLRHYAPYEPDRYIEWAQRASMRTFFGNLEDPSLLPMTCQGGLLFYPAAFWLEPHWRDTRRFTVDWLLSRAERQDIVMLVHPENVLENPNLLEDFNRIIASIETKIINPVFA